MTHFAGTPSDDLPDVLATGQNDVATWVVSLSARHPEGLDAEYLRWHTLDHRPEQHRLDGMRGSHRFVSTPACRAAREVSDAEFDDVDHVMLYLFAEGATLDGFFALGRALHEGGRMPIRLPSIGLETFVHAGQTAAARVVAGADVVAWRPATGAHLLIEQGSADPSALSEVDGVAGVWWATRADDDGHVHQVTVSFCDDDPVAVAGRMRGPLALRWSDDSLVPRLAAPFHTVVPFEWDRHLP